MSQFGLIYIISNSKQGKNVFKVGKTSKQIDQRLKQLNSETGLIGKFKVFASFAVDDIDEAEKICHNELDDYRIQDNREFFEIEYSEIMEIVRECIRDYILKEYLEVQLSSKDEKKINENRQKQRNEYLGFTDDDDFDDLINKKKSKQNKQNEEKNEESEKLKIFVNKNKKIFSQFIDKLKKDLKKYKHINFYKYTHTYRSQLTATEGYEIVISKNNKEDIEASIKSSKIYEGILQSFVKKIPYNQEQKNYIKGSLLEDRYLKQEYAPHRTKLNCDDIVYRIEFSNYNSSLYFLHLEKRYRRSIFRGAQYSKYQKKEREELDDNSSYFKGIYNYGRAFKAIRERFVSEIADENKSRYRGRYVYFDEKDKDLNYARSIQK